MERGMIRSLLKVLGVPRREVCGSKYCVAVGLCRFTSSRWLPGP